MPYATLDLSRITAVQALDKTTDCNKCIKVVNTKNNKFIYALAVDLGGMGLDLSIPSFKELFGQQYDASPASWSETDYSNCAGIYSKGGSSNSSSSSAVFKSTSTKSASHARPTTTRASHAHPTVTKIKSAHHGHPTTKVKKPSSLARPASTKTKSAHRGRPTTIKPKSSHHGRPTATKSKSSHHGRPTTTKPKSKGHGCPIKKHKPQHKKHSTAGRRKQQQKENQ
jgi:hypothetical protein